MRNGSLKRLTRNGSTASSESGPPRLSSRTPVRGVRAGDGTGITLPFYNGWAARCAAPPARGGLGRPFSETARVTARVDSRQRLPDACGVARLLQQVLRRGEVFVEDGELFVEERLDLGSRVIPRGLDEVDDVLVAVRHHLREAAVEVLAGHG